MEERDAVGQLISAALVLQLVVKAMALDARVATLACGLLALAIIMPMAHGASKCSYVAMLLYPQRVIIVQNIKSVQL